MRSMPPTIPHCAFRIPHWGRLPCLARQSGALVAAGAFFTIAGCATAPPIQDTDARHRMLALLMPGRIEIVEPFTRIKSFDGGAEPDGIELLLRAVNTLGNPGLMLVGHVRVELFEHVAASGQRRGRRLESWNVELATEEDQRTHWNQLTQMYELRLRVDPNLMPSDDRFVLVVTYTSPLGEHLTAECVLRYKAS